MRIGAFEFSPALLPSLVTLVLLPVLVGLGMWQLDRAEWKQGLIDTHKDRTGRARAPLDQLYAKGAEVEYRAVAALGSYDLGHQLLLDNRTYNGQAGYHVLTPLVLADTDLVVLVNRGWIPLGQNRGILPELPGPADELVVNGILKLPPQRIFRLGMEEEAGTGWPRVVQQIDIPRLEELLGRRLLPYLLLLDKDDEYGFIRDWRPVYGISPDKHRAYALQWFTLALVLLLIYIGVNTKRITKPTAENDDEEA
jgi:surfeit locus 1 family protein